MIRSGLQALAGIEVWSAIASAIAKTAKAVLLQITASRTGFASPEEHRS